jgi:hypothetical protein
LTTGTGASVLEAGAARRRRLVKIAAVENDRCFQPGLDGLEVGAAKLLPFGNDGQRIRAIERRHRARRVANARILAKHAFRLVHRHRIIGADRSATRQQLGDQHPAGRLAHVVGVRLEGQAPEGDGLARRSSPRRLAILREHALLRVVGLFNRLQHLEL